MFLALGYYVTESSGHNSEYNWWFRKRPDLIEKYCTHGTGWNPGEYAYILKEYQQDRGQLEGWRTGRTGQGSHAAATWSAGTNMPPTSSTPSRAANPSSSTATCRNTGLITNLPEGACVEVPVYVDKAGFHPFHVGALPPECALLTQLSSGIEEMAITAALTGDPVMVYRAICHDPLTAAVLSLAEIRNMVNEMLAQNQEYLPMFKVHKV